MLWDQRYFIGLCAGCHDSFGNDASIRRPSWFSRDSSLPPLSWERFAELIRDDDRYDGAALPDEFAFIPDPDDRKFAALSAATGAVLVTNDDHLLAHRERIESAVLTRGEFRRRDSHGCD